MAIVVLHEHSRRLCAPHPELGPEPRPGGEDRGGPPEAVPARLLREEGRGGHGANTKEGSCQDSRRAKNAMNAHSRRPARSSWIGA
eukprot:2859257-Pyramimonas_sp.AAC.1